MKAEALGDTGIASDNLRAHFRLLCKNNSSACLSPEAFARWDHARTNDPSRRQEDRELPSDHLGISRVYTIGAKSAHTTPLLEVSWQSGTTGIRFDVQH